MTGIPEQQKAPLENDYQLGAMLSAIMDNTGAAIYVKDTDGRYILVNRLFGTLFNCANETVKGLTDHDIFPKEIADAFRANDLEAMRLQVPLRREELVPQDDGIHTYISVKFSLRDQEGRPYAVCGVSTDITERKRIEHEIQVAHDKQAANIQQMPIAYIQFDDRFHIVEWNKAAENIFGFTKDEVLGRHPIGLLVPEKIRPIIEEVIRKLLNGTVADYSEPDNVMRKDGTVISCKWHNLPIINESGKVTGVLSMAEDVTERVAAEKKLHANNALLRSMTMELTRIEEREWRNVAQELHDGMGQTLAIAKLKLSALNCACDCNLKQEISEIEAMMDQSNLAVRSLSLQLSPPVLREHSLANALKWLADEMQRSYGLNISLHTGNLPGQLDETLLNPIFRATRELLINVIKHSGVNSANLDAICEDGNLVVSVTDNGVGFNMHRRMEPSAKGGYGLFSIRERIMLIGGDVQIDSSPGDGVVAVITVPLKPEQARMEA